LPRADDWLGHVLLERLKGFSPRLVLYLGGRAYLLTDSTATSAGVSAHEDFLSWRTRSWRRGWQLSHHTLADRTYNSTRHSTGRTKHQGRYLCGISSSR